MACDLCGKTGTTLTGLRPQYRTEHIEDVCPDCAEKLNDHLRKLHAVGRNFIDQVFNKFIRDEKSRCTKDE